MFSGVRNSQRIYTDGGNQSLRVVNEFLVSKETVLRDQNKNLPLSNELIKVELPP